MYIGNDKFIQIKSSGTFPASPGSLAIEAELWCEWTSIQSCFRIRFNVFLSDSHKQQSRASGVVMEILEMQSSSLALRRFNANSVTSTLLPSIPFHAGWQRMHPKPTFHPCGHLSLIIFCNFEGRRENVGNHNNYSKTSSLNWRTLQIFCILLQHSLIVFNNPSLIASIV